MKKIFAIICLIGHKIKFLREEKRLLGHTTKRGWCHDIDLLWYYCNPLISKKRGYEKHRAISSHHVRNLVSKTREDHIETLIDWQVRYGKTYNVLIKSYSDQTDIYLPLIKEFYPEQIKQTLEN